MRAITPLYSQRKCFCPAYCQGHLHLEESYHLQVFPPLLLCRQPHHSFLRCRRVPSRHSIHLVNRGCEFLTHCSELLLVFCLLFLLTILQFLVCRLPPVPRCIHIRDLHVKNTCRPPPTEDVHALVSSLLLFFCLQVLVFTLHLLPTLLLAIICLLVLRLLCCIYHYYMSHTIVY